MSLIARKKVPTSRSASTLLRNSRTPPFTLTSLSLSKTVLTIWGRAFPSRPFCLLEGWFTFRVTRALWTGAALSVQQIRPPPRR
jgi:hypothetical protein